MYPEYNPYSTPAPGPSLPGEYTPPSFLTRHKKGLMFLLVVILLAAGATLYFIATNNYKTPVKHMAKAMSAKTYSDYIDTSVDALNGVGEEQMREIYDIKNSYDDAVVKTVYDEGVALLAEEYGDDYTYKYNIGYRYTLSEDELSNFENNLHSTADGIRLYIDNYYRATSQEKAAMAELMNVSTSSLKKMITQMNDLADIWGTASVSEGYELEITPTVTGSNVENGKELEQITIFVYKVNGRWISGTSLTLATLFS